ncbi:hypothetical protein GCM10009117_13790 [Gangjinia marincola]|uniref:Plasmid pRiA4b Orf3-like domain-containing protein n=1 Tax=Gangjinia marincola TaxID=578463 RepID=A0ABN1MGD6_9FLAO
MIYRFRVILDTKDDVFRDIEVKDDITMEDFHNSITQAFGFEGNEMASFYQSDEEWNQGEEIALFDMSEGTSQVRIMNETALDEMVTEQSPRLIYVYDFLSMWTFLVELAEIAEPDYSIDYPNLIFAHGELPPEAPDKEFNADDNDLDLDDDLDVDNYDDLDFDENWN